MSRMARLNVKSVSNYVVDHLKLDNDPSRKFDLLAVYMLIGNVPRLFMPMVCKDAYMHYTSFYYATLDNSVQKKLGEDQEYYDLRVIDRCNLKYERNFLESNENVEPADILLRVAFGINKVSPLIHIKGITSEEFNERIKRSKDTTVLVAPMISMSKKKGPTIA